METILEMVEALEAAERIRKTMPLLGSEEECDIVEFKIIELGSQIHCDIVEICDSDSEECLTPSTYASTWNLIQD